LIIGRLGKLSKDSKRPLIAIVLGIRPDIVRAATLLKLFQSEGKVDFKFIWSGQHYSTNLKDDFLSELDCPKPDFELNVDIETDISLVSSGISNLGKLLQEIKPDAVVFLGDTNTVLLSLAPSILGIPVLHIEGCMRSFDIEMPEERNRRIIDHLSSRIYAYLPRYKQLGLEEGIPESGILVTGNLAVDAVENFTNMPSWVNLKEKMRIWRKSIGVSDKYILMTCHRRENIGQIYSMTNIIRLAGDQKFPVLFAAGYATQRKLQEYEIKLPENITICDPLEYGRFLPALIDAQSVLTDSGTVVEEAAILGVPSVQMRRSTERPEVYDCGASIKFNPHLEYKFIEAKTSNWIHGLGDGNAARRIYDDICSWINNRDRFDARTGLAESIIAAWKSN
jgi:UDP-N-acetylglucosamine 2-epimerase (non-hydrolysing)